MADATRTRDRQWRCPTRKNHLEVRFALPRRLDGGRIKRSTAISKTSHQHSLDITADADVDAELLGWLSEAYSRTGA